MDSDILAKAIGLARPFEREEMMAGIAEQILHGQGGDSSWLKGLEVDQRVDIGNAIRKHAAEQSIELPEALKTALE